MIADVARAPASIDSEVGEQRAHALRIRREPHGDLERDAEASLGADECAEQVVAVRLAAGVAERRRSRRRREPPSSATTWLSVTPYLRQCGPPAFSATLPPIVQAAWLDGSGA